LIKHAVFDVDGVFTDGTFHYNKNGKVSKVFGAHDSDAIKFLRYNNIQVQAITADKRGYKISEARMDDMGIPLQLVSEGERLRFLSSNFSFKTMLFIGDGLHDAEVLARARIGICPANGCDRAKMSANFVTERSGGNGVLLEAVEWLSNNGYMEHKLEAYLDIKH
jgi:3-deoxy-D-manno-octulosonate 8-phosphate phosphatase (KDO 8-P phosphatase)